MKSLDDRITLFMSKIFRVEELSASYEIDFHYKLRKVLVEQDKITRHACADLIISMDSVESTEDGDLVYLNDVHQDVINCNGGVK